MLSIVRCAGRSRLRAAALLSLPFVCLLPGTSASPQSGAPGAEHLQRFRQALNKPGVANSISGSGALASTTAIRFVNDSFPSNVQSSLPSFVGWGFNYDAENNDWILVSKIADLTVPSVDPMADPFEISVDLRDRYQGQQSLSANSFSASIDASWGLMQAAAQVAISNSSSSSMSQRSFSVAMTQSFGVQVADLPGDAFPFTTEAADYLANDAPVTGAEGWTQEFGEYIAVGYEVGSEVEAILSLASTETLTTSTSFASIRASYMGTSGSASFGSIVQNAAEDEAIDLNLVGEGVDLSSIVLPTVSNGVTVDQFVTNLQSVMTDGRRARGLLMIPSTALPGVPEFGLNSLDTISLGTSASAMRSAMLALVDSDRWVGSAAIRSFLDQHENLDELGMGTGVSMRDEMIARRDAVRTSLLSVYDKWQDLADSEGDPGLKAALDSEVVTLNSGVQQLRDILDRFDIYAIGNIWVDTLSDPEIEVVQGPDFLGGSGAFGTPFTTVLVLRDVAAFPAQGVPSLETFLKLPGVLRVGVKTDLSNNNHQVNWFDYENPPTSPGYIEDISILSIDLHTDPMDPSRLGLLDLEVEVTFVPNLDNSRWFHVRFIDDLGRVTSHRCRNSVVPGDMPGDPGYGYDACF